MGFMELAKGSGERPACAQDKNRILGRGGGASRRAGLALGETAGTAGNWDQQGEVPGEDLKDCQGLGPRVGGAACR